MQVDRDKEIKKLAREIALRVKKLKKLNCGYSGQGSDILLFDDSITELKPEERYIGDLENGVDKYHTVRF